MSSARFAVVAAAVVPAIVLAVYAYVLIPLEVGRGVIGGYEAAKPPAITFLAGAVWLTMAGWLTWRLAKFGADVAITRWMVAKRTIGAFCFVVTTGYVLAAIPMGGVIDALTYQGIEVGFDTAWLGFPLLHTFLWSAAIGAALFVVVLAELIAHRVWLVKRGVNRAGQSADSDSP